MTRELSRRNIISVNTENGEETLHIHRTLQQKILEDLDKDPRRREEVFFQAYELVRKKFPLPSPIQVPEPAKWPACREYLPHVLHLVNVTTNLLPSILPSVKLARLFSDGGINLWERGMTSEGLRLLKSAEAILDRLENDESHLKANIHVIINLLIQDFGLSHIAESKNRIRKALKIRLNFLVQCTPQLYTRTDAILLHNAWSDYGCVLLQYNEYQRAEPMFRKCLTKYRDWGTETDIPYEYYKYNHHVAFCRLYQRDFAGAIELAEKSLRLIILATGESSAASKTRFDLACIVLQSGDTQRALALHKEVLASNLRLHGRFNFLTLQSYYSVGVVSAYTGTLPEAEYANAFLVYDDFALKPIEPELTWALTHRRSMKKALALEQSRKGSWSEVANARTEFYLAQILKQQGKELDSARQLESQARVVLAKLLPLNPLEGVEAGDEIALFDHLQPVFDGRFAGRGLLKYVSKAV